MNLKKILDEDQFERLWEKLGIRGITLMRVETVPDHNGWYECWEPDQNDYDNGWDNNGGDGNGGGGIGR